MTDDEWKAHLSACRKAQSDLCIKNHWPNFAGDGYCSQCGKNAFARESVESAGKNLVTDCPYCARSWCD